MDPQQPLTIGQLSRRAGLPVDTVRFYEKQGLVPQPARRASGYRQYPATTVGRLRFIQSAKAVGFSLKEIRELLALRVTRGKTCADVKARAHEKLTDLDRRLAELQRVRAALSRLAASCTGRGPTSECPLLDALDHEGEAHAQS
ncbi:MAG: heavy metal-responsive transcriptional regulator [Myxococcaceae bacterium]